MRIFDVENDAALKSVRLYLTSPEASELRDSLEAMLERNENFGKIVLTVD